MNYQEAKFVLMEKKPSVPMTLYAVEAATMFGVAGILVQVFT